MCSSVALVIFRLHSPALNFLRHIVHFRVVFLILQFDTMVLGHMWKLLIGGVEAYLHVDYIVPVDC